MSTTSYSHPPDTVSGVTTTWLPMITPWPPIAECKNVYSPLSGGNAYAYNPSIGGTNLLVRCLPPEATSWLEQTRFTPYFTVTSIGPMVCPNEYSTVTQISLDSSSTLVRCCPSSYTYSSIVNSNSAECMSSAKADQNGFYAGSSGNWYFVGTVASFGDPDNPFTFVPVTAPLIEGYNFARAAITSSASSLTASQSTIPQPSPPSPDGLSAGAKAGIGIGVALGVLGLCSLFGAWLFIRKRSRKPKSAVGDGDTVSKSELDSSGIKPVRHEADSAQQYEMDGQQPLAVQELDGSVVERTFRPT